jgi:hypothetical protein
MTSDNLLLRPVARPWLPAIALRIGVTAALGTAATFGFLALRSPAPKSYVLSLQADRRTDAIYFTAFDNADQVVVDHIDQPITFRRNFTWMDGCTWQAVEELTPARDGFTYHYAEHPEACPNGEKPDGSPSVVTGHITVNELDHLEPATSLGPNAHINIVSSAPLSDDDLPLDD